MLMKYIKLIMWAGQSAGHSKCRYKRGNSKPLKPVKQKVQSEHPVTSLHNHKLILEPPSHSCGPLVDDVNLSCQFYWGRHRESFHIVHSKFQRKIHKVKYFVINCLNWKFMFTQLFLSTPNHNGFNFNMTSRSSQSLFLMFCRIHSHSS